MRDCLAQIANFCQQQELPFVSVIREGEDFQELLIVDFDKLVGEAYRLSAHEKLLRENLLQKLADTEMYFGLHALTIEELDDLLFQTQLLSGMVPGVVLSNFSRKR